MATTDTTVSNLIINKLTQAQYEAIATPSDTELYLTTDGAISSSDVTNALGYTPQTELVSGTNIKTINSTSLLGSGNISIPDTKDTTGSSNSSSKLYLVGAGNQSTSAVTYSKSTVYANTDGTLNCVTPASTKNDTTVATTKWVKDLGYTTNTGTVTSVNNVSPVNGNVTLSIPTVNDATLTIQKNGTTVNTFSANASSNVTANITIPTQASDIGAQEALVSGTNIKTINSTPLLGSGNIDTSEIFVATYNTTTRAEIDAAYIAGKQIVVKYNDGTLDNFYWLEKAAYEAAYTFVGVDINDTYRTSVTSYGWEAVTTRINADNTLSNVSSISNLSAVKTALDGKADTSLSNLSATGQAVLDNKLNNSQITNCILEAPNGVYTKSGFVVTIKNGLKVLMPDGRNVDGTLKNKEVTLTEDMTIDFSTYSGAQYRTGMLYINSSNELAVITTVTSHIFYIDKASNLPTTLPDNYTTFYYCKEENYWYSTTGSTTASWSAFKAIPLIAGYKLANSTEYNINYVKEPVYICDTDMVDGQWIIADIAINVNTNKSIGSYDFSLGSYLPNDGYKYEVMIHTYGTLSSSATSPGVCSVWSDIFTLPGQTASYAQVVATTVARSNTNDFVIPVGTSRKIYYEIASNAFSSLYIRIYGYRRIGKNV